MQNNLESRSGLSVARKKRRTAILIAGLFVLLCLIPAGILKTSIESREPPALVIRVDDIQDFAFR